jgi:hypothetical protein
MILPAALPIRPAIVALGLGRSLRFGRPVCHQRLLSSAVVPLAEHPTPVTSTGSSRNDRTRFVVAAIAAAVGFVWLLQGLGVVPGSFMSSDPIWAVAGLILIAAAVVYAAWPRLRRR